MGPLIVRSMGENVGIGLEDTGHDKLAIGKDQASYEGQDRDHKSQPEDDGHLGPRGGHMMFDSVGHEVRIGGVLDFGQLFSEGFDLDHGAIIGLERG